MMFVIIKKHFWMNYSFNEKCILKSIYIIVCTQATAHYLAILASL